MVVPGWVYQGVGVFFEYDTPKIVHIRSKKIGILSRLVQILIVSYIVGFVIIYKKGYQETENVVSAVTSKLKGNILTNFTDSELTGVKPEWRHLYSRIWDVTDLVVPPVENNAFFITTNIVITPNQTRGHCPEHPSLLPCQFDSDCSLAHTGGVQAHGVPTGRCNLTTRSCVLEAWCPLPEEIQLPLGPSRAVLDGSHEFTVLVKNMVNFPAFGRRRSNWIWTGLERQKELQLNTCHNSAEQPFCPVFTLGNIVAASGNNYSQMAVLGGVMNVDISWECDLDWDFLTYCQPAYTFRRLDNPEAKISPGSNFRHADYFNHNKRTLTKAYGITFIVNVHGTAGKFGIVPTLLNLGAGLALLSLATVICDIVVLYCHKHRNYYKQSKFQQVRGEDAFPSRYKISDGEQEARSAAGQGEN